jgi:hypothetical protein
LDEFFAFILRIEILPPGDSQAVSRRRTRSNAMREFLTMWDAYMAFFDNLLAVGQRFVVCSRPGCVFERAAGNKILCQEDQP